MSVTCNAIKPRLPADSTIQASAFLGCRFTADGYDCTSMGADHYPYL